MTKPTLSDRLNHISENIAHIRKLLDHKTITALDDAVTRAAFERFLEIISEASRHLDVNVKQAQDNIPWRQIADLGNALRHACHKIDREILWGIYEYEIGALEIAIGKMMKDIEPND